MSAQLEFNCSGHSDYYIDLNSVRLHLRIKLVKTDGSDIVNTTLNTVGCVNNFLYSMFSSLSISLKGKPVFLHETNYHYKAYIEKILNYGSDASSTHLISLIRLENLKKTIKLPQQRLNFRIIWKTPC